MEAEGPSSRYGECRAVSADLGDECEFTFFIWLCCDCVADDSDVGALREGKECIMVEGVAWREKVFWGYAILFEDFYAIENFLFLLVEWYAGEFGARPKGIYASTAGYVAVVVSMHGDSPIFLLPTLDYAPELRIGVIDLLSGVCVCGYYTDQRLDIIFVQKGFDARPIFAEHCRTGIIEPNQVVCVHRDEFSRGGICRGYRLWS